LHIVELIAEFKLTTGGAARHGEMTLVMLTAFAVARLNMQT
jgi:hypothetical protein